MKAQIESTAEITDLVAPDGGMMPARQWKGRTESGVEFVAYITRIQVLTETDNSEFERELMETTPPRRELKMVDFRLVL